jgi:hypothetical protein
MYYLSKYNCFLSRSPTSNCISKFCWLCKSKHTDLITSLTDAEMSLHTVYTYSVEYVLFLTVFLYAFVGLEYFF